MRDTLAILRPGGDAPRMPEIVRLTDIRGRRVVDAGGRAVGRLADLIVDHREPYPVVVAMEIRRGRAEVLAPWSAVTRVGEEEIVLDATRRAASRGVRLVRDLLDAQVVDISGHRLARVGEIELALRDCELRAVAVDVGLAPVVRRLGLRRLAKRLPGEVIGWDGIHFATGRGHRMQLASRAAAVHRLSPEELAQVAFKLPPGRGAELLRAVAPDTAEQARRLPRPARRRRFRVMRARKRAPS